MARPPIYPSKPKRPRRWIRWLLVVAVSVLVVLLGIERIGGLIAKARLQKIASQQLNGKLTLGTVTYLPPNRLRLYDLNFRSQENQNIAADEIDLTLDKSTFKKDEKLVIRNLLITRPVVHLSNNVGSGIAIGSTQPTKNVSELFQCDHLQIVDGQFDYQRAKCQGVDVTAERKARSEYAVHLEMHNTAGHLTSEATFDIESLVLDIASASANVSISNQQALADLPDGLRDALTKVGIHGSIELLGKGRIPLKDPNHSTLEATAQIKNGQLKLSDWPSAFENVQTAPFALGLHSARIKKLDLDYGKDHWTVGGATLNWVDIRKEIHVAQMNATVAFDRSSPGYAGKFGHAVAMLHPSGKFDVDGSITWRPKTDPRKSEFLYNITSSDASLMLTERKIVIDHVRSSVVATDNFIDIHHLEGVTLGGQIAAQVHISATQPIAYQGIMTASALDVAELGRLFNIRDDGKSRLAGRGFVSAKFDGDGPTTDGLRAEGEVQILDGNLWQVPLLQRIVAKIEIARDALTASEGAATFSIKHRTIELKDALINAPVLGLEGSGKVGFDGNMDVKVIAAPLSDWKQGLKETNIPVLSNVVGEVAGGLQKIVNAATKTLLYEFHLIGDASDPKIETIPAPALTNGAAQLFESVLQLKPGQHALDALHKRNSDEGVDHGDGTN